MIIIIVNGYPRSGKDTFMAFANDKYRCYQHSTIDICKEICEHLGWGGEKNDESRAMLAELKQWYIKYFDGVFNDFRQEVAWTISNTYLPNDFFFVVSREGAEIKRIKDWCKDYGYKCVYVFIDRDDGRDYGNNSDNNVLSDCKPDIILSNRGDLETFKEATYDLLSRIRAEKNDPDS